MVDPLRTPSADALLAGPPLHAASTELQRVRGQLRALQQRCELHLRALRAIGDGVVTVDHGGRIRFMNPVAAHLCGWREDDAVGRQVEDVLAFSDGRGERIDLRQPADVAGTLRRRDRHSVQVEGSVTPLAGVQDGEDGWVVIFRNVTAARRLAEELSYHANHDALTGLSNRRAFESRLKRAVASAREQGARHALVYIDLDRFKHVNDRAGHVAGDELLRQVAMAMRRQLRQEDMLARLGGDEFAALLDDCLPAQSALVAEKIRAALAGHVFHWQGKRLRIGASLGLVDFCHGTRSAAQLLARADALCYQAKREGRNRVAVDPVRAGVQAELPLAG